MELDNDVVAGTYYLWRTPLSYLADERTVGADKATVFDLLDPLSPLTPHAVFVTARSKPNRGRGQAPPPSERPLVVLDGIPLGRWYLQRVLPSVMLHGEVINAYVFLLERREATWALAEQRPPQCLFFNTLYGCNADDRCANSVQLRPSRGGRGT